MSGNTKIQWATKVWNPIVGCTPVSEGCVHCYAKRMYERFYQGRPFSKVQLHPERLEDPMRWLKPQRVFVDSMSDLFHDEISGDFIEDVVETISNCPKHIFMVLTKRPKRMRFLFSEVMAYLAIHPLRNLWLGVSVSSDQDMWMIDELLETPAAVRFVSVEPMLGPINLVPYIQYPPFNDNYKLTWDATEFQGLDWVICGGESGPGARPMHPDWVRSLRDQCVAADVPFFFKQWGEWSSEFPQKLSMANRKQTYIHGHEFFCIGKSMAGRLLDGREWNEFPGEKKHEKP